MVPWTPHPTAGACLRHAACLATAHSRHVKAACKQPSSLQLTSDVTHGMCLCDQTMCLNDLDHVTVSSGPCRRLPASYVGKYCRVHACPSRHIQKSTARKRRRRHALATQTAILAQHDLQKSEDKHIPGFVMKCAVLCVRSSCMSPKCCVMGHHEAHSSKDMGAQLEHNWTYQVVQKLCNRML